MAFEVGAYKGARKQAFLMALRLAWRDARKHKGRSALIVTLIALPVAGMTMIALLITSSQMTPQERIDAELGTAQAHLVPGMGSGYQQMPTNPNGGFPIGEPDPDFMHTPPLEAVPAGYGVLVEEEGPLELSKGKVPVYSSIVFTELFHPAFDTRYDLVDGSRDAEEDAVYLSVALGKRMGLGLGDALKVGSEAYPLAGLVREGGRSGDNETAFALPGHPLLEGQEHTMTSVFLLGDDPLTWSEVKELNTVGVGALSRAVLLNPPGASELPEGAVDYEQQNLVMGILATSVVGSLVLLEVGLLAGAAFAVGAKGQRRMLALIAAAGGEKSTVRSIVTASGVVLGAIGVLVGAAVGISFAAVWVYWHLSNHSPAFAGFHLVWWPIVAFIGLGFVASVVAALAPASAIARQNVFTAVKSAHSASRAAKRIPWGGLVMLVSALIAGGAGIALAVTTPPDERLQSRALLLIPLLGLGSILFLVGLLMCTGRIVDLLSRAASKAPTSLRMAARDASRNRGRSVPATAAVLAAMAVAAVVMVGSATLARDAEYRQYQSLRDLQGSVSLTAYDEDDGSLSSRKAAPAVEAVEAVVGTVQDPTVITGVRESCAPDTECANYMMQLPPESACASRIEEGTADPATCRDPAMGGGGLPFLVADDAAALKSILGHQPSGQAVAALESGKAVVLDPSWIEDGQITILERTWDAAKAQPVEPRNIIVDAVAVQDAPNLPVGAVMSPDTAEKLGLPVMDEFVVMDLPEQPTNAVADEINAKLFEVTDGQAHFTFNHPGPPTEQILWAISGVAALVALSAAAVTAGLALADGRTDHVTLAGVGAAPTLRKRLAAAQTAFGAGLGVVLGMPAGILPAVAVLTALQRYQLVIPWPQLVALVVLVPLIGAGAAWLFTRARLPMTRRALLQ